MKRRGFLKVSAGAVGSFSVVYPAVVDVIDIKVPDDVPLEEIEASQTEGIENIPVRMRLMNGGMVLTDWFHIRNDTPELVIEEMKGCVLTHLECVADLRGYEIPFELPVPNAQVSDGDKVKIVFGQKGVVELG